MVVQAWKVLVTIYILLLCRYGFHARCVCAYPDYRETLFELSRVAIERISLPFPFVSRREHRSESMLTLWIAFDRGLAVLLIRSFMNLLISQRSLLNNTTLTWIVRKNQKDFCSKYTDKSKWKVNHVIACDNEMRKLTRSGINYHFHTEKILKNSVGLFPREYRFFLTLNDQIVNNFVIKYLRRKSQNLMNSNFKFARNKIEMKREERL